MLQNTDYPTQIYTVLSGDSDCISCETCLIEQISRISEYHAGMWFRDFAEVFRVSHFYVVSISLQFAMRPK